MENLNIAYLFQIALRRIWALILAMVVCAGLAFSYCKFVAVPEYTAQSSILVTNGAIMVGGYVQGTTGDDTVKSTDISASLMLANTIVDVLKTPDIYKILAEELGGDYTYRALKSMASIARRNGETLFIDIAFRTNSSEESVRLANEFAHIACEYIAEFVPYSIAKVTSEADGASQVHPVTFLTTAIAAVAGLVLSYAVVLIFDLTDRAIKGESEFVEKFDIPLLGVVPDFDDGEITGSYGKKRKGGYRSGY